MCFPPALCIRARKIPLCAAGPFAVLFPRPVPKGLLKRKAPYITLVVVGRSKLGTREETPKVRSFVRKLRLTLALCSVALPLSPQQTNQPPTTHTHIDSGVNFFGLPPKPQAPASASTSSFLPSFFFVLSPSFSARGAVDTPSSLSLSNWPSYFSRCCFVASLALSLFLLTRTDGRTDGGIRKMRYLFPSPGGRLRERGNNKASHTNTHTRERDDMTLFRARCQTQRHTLCTHVW